MKKLIAVFLCIMLVTGCSYAFAGDAWVCPQCGAENGENFCVKCGTPKPEMLVCPACGEQYPPDSGVVFCGKCGTKILQNDLSSGKLEGPGFDTPEEALALSEAMLDKYRGNEWIHPILAPHGTTTVSEEILKKCHMSQHIKN